MLNETLLDALVFIAMVLCSFASVAGGSCGPSNENPCSVDFVNLKDCNRDITAHLKSCRLAKNKYIDTEMTLNDTRTCRSVIKVLVILMPQIELKPRNDLNIYVFSMLKRASGI